MAFDPITAVLSFFNIALEKWIPDANMRAQAAQAMANDFNQQVMGQLAINLKEAESQSLFVSGWRPFIGWVCGGAYAYNFAIQPFLVFLITAGQIHLDIAQLPHLDWSELSFVLFGMLGLGAMRTYEKKLGSS